LRELLAWRSVLVAQLQLRRALREFAVDPTLIRDDMRYWRLTPDARLRQHVRCYFLALPAPNFERPPLPLEELLLPDADAEIVFILSGAFERWPLGERLRSMWMRASYAIGGRSHSVITTATPDLVVAGVKLEGAALRRLVDVPLSAFRETTLPLSDAPRGDLLELEDALTSARSIGEVKAAFDRHLLRALNFIARPGDAAIRTFAAHVHRERGAVRIGEWLRRERLDPRSFERRFCAWTGMTPKRYARVVRFKHAYFEWIRRQREPAERTRSCYLDGYYDAAHFARDLRAYVGAPGNRQAEGASRPMTGISEHLLKQELSVDR
jgi:AraC-like DNA-binding protein